MESAKQGRGKIWFGVLIGAVLALVSAAVALAVIVPIHPGGAPRQFSAFGCDYEIQFNGTVLDDKDTPSALDDEYTWSYTVTELDGPGCDLSHWVIALCADAFAAYLDSQPDPSFLTTNDPGTTGLTGVKWNDILNGFVSGTFTFTLSQDFPLDTDVDVGLKTGAGVVPGTIEGPSCAALPTPTPPTGVGGTTEILVDGSVAPASVAAGGSGSSIPLYAALAGGAAAAFALMAAGGWYARRRLLR